MINSPLGAPINKRKKMLLWIAIAVFGFSIALTWYNASKKKNDRKNKLDSIRKQIEENEKAKEREKNKLT